MAGLNGARSSLASRGAKVFVVLEPAARHLWLQHCPDADAALAAQAEIRYEPTGKATLAAARRELAEAYRARFRRLDLRGLVRSEAEDVGRDLLVMYQGLRARTPRPGADGAQAIDTVIAHHVTARGRGAPVVLLGGPGAGKSFYLRRCALHGSTHGLFGVAKPIPVLVHAGAFDARSDLPLRTQLVEHLLAWAPITGRLPRGAPRAHLAFAPRGWPGRGRGAGGPCGASQHGAGDASDGRDRAGLASDRVRDASDHRRAAGRDRRPGAVSDRRIPDPVVRTLRARPRRRGGRGGRSRRGGEPGAADRRAPESGGARGQPVVADGDGHRSPRRRAAPRSPRRAVQPHDARAHRALEPRALTVRHGRRACVAHRAGVATARAPGAQSRLLGLPRRNPRA
jgi:hypothetical protein